jgi:hypothetical protein
LNDLWSFDLGSRESLLLFTHRSSHLLYSENKSNSGISGPRRRFPITFPSNWTCNYRTREQDLDVRFENLSSTQDQLCLDLAELIRNTTTTIPGPLIQFTRTWAELQCIGFIPPPREGHSAALVDDVVYVYRVDGKDLGDLGAFKISSRVSLNLLRLSQRSTVVHVPKHGPCAKCSFWPSIELRVFVLGGVGAEFMNPAKPEDPTLIHVLDTSACFCRFPLIICLMMGLEHIKYPESNKTPQ